jgi:CHAD domain-containing protein
MAKVSKLNKYVKNDIIDSIVKPTEDKLDQFQKEIKETIEKKFYDTFPEELKIVCDKYPEYKHNLWVNHYDSYSYSTSIMSFCADKTGNIYTSTLPPSSIKEIDLLVGKYETLRKKNNEFKKELLNILDSYTVKQVMETFPEISHLIPERDGSLPCNLPSLQVESIKEKINNQPLTV